MHGSPLVVVGAGIAGLCTALAAAPRRVVLLSRGGGEETASALAQGGLAAALAPGDSPTAHAADTLVAGAGHNDPDAVRLLTAQAAAAVGWLLRHGVRFDREDGLWCLAREGGHRHARILHADGDGSGRALVNALSAAACAASHIEWRRGVEVEGLLLRGGRVIGVHGRRGEAAFEQEAAAVVLATGGIGALFACTTNPAGADGSGLALGLEAGAEARDLEFVQFHPTALAAGSGATRRPLVTEALRGAGAVLRDRAGRPLMAGVHPLGDLAPRDVVARRVWQALQDGDGAFLHAQHLGETWPTRFPTVWAACRAHGIDPREAPIPVEPAAHFHMGGLAVDLDGRTSLPGLYAVGEVACSGVHGANRLASNSLLECLVYAESAAQDILARPGSSLPDLPAWDESRVTDADEEVVIAHNWDELRRFMWDYVGIVRTNKRLERALHRIRLLEREIDEYYAHFRISNDLIELRNLVMTAHLIVRSAMQRHESRGLHFSRDYPDTSDAASPTILRPRRSRQPEEQHATTV